jgi:hypothetical protein
LVTRCRFVYRGLSIFVIGLKSRYCARRPNFMGGSASVVPLILFAVYGQRRGH